MTYIPSEQLKEDFKLAIKLANRGCDVCKASKEVLDILQPLNDNEKKLVAKLKRAIQRFEEADR